MEGRAEIFKESYEIIEQKLKLAEMTIKLGEVTREKWKRLETMRDILSEEEQLIKEITEFSKGLSTNNKT